MPCRGRVVLVGGNANNSGTAGAFNVNTNNASTNANSNIGRQLSLWHRYIIFGARTLPLGKTRNHAPAGLVGLMRPEDPGANKQTGD